MRRCLSFIVCLMLAAVAAWSSGGAGAAPFHEGQFIFAPEPWHNHGSCIVECPNGDLLACWFHGKGEKTDEVIIEGARRVKGAAGWGERFVMADTPNYPDHNPCMFVDPQQRLWLLWPTLLANQWGTAVMKYRISSSYQMREGPPAWEWQDLIHVTPTNFEQQIEAALERYAPQYGAMIESYGERFQRYVEALRERAGDRLQQRLGWMTRAHPTVLPSGRLIVPLYTDAFSVSIMAISDDWGQTWMTSEALVGFGNIQPSVVRKNDGTLVAMMRENGRQRRIRTSESKDDGLTWSPVGNMALPNPGSGLEVIRLANGQWALIYNDTAEGRHSLAVSISDDEGETWRWTRHLERCEPGQGSYAYPSLIQARDGMLHATYSYSVPNGSTIKHVTFNEDWVRHGNDG